MKNTIKRVLLLIPVISVLLFAFAVPAFADYSPETGWDAPVGTFSSFITDVTIDGENMSVPVGSPFEWNGGEVIFNYKMVFNSWPESGPGSTWFTSKLFLLHISGVDEGGSAYDTFILCDGLKTSGSTGNIFYYRLAGTYTERELNLNNVNAEFYFSSYPFSIGVGELVQNYSFMVYEVASPSPTEPIGNVWTGIMTWITSAFNSVMGAFYVDGSLTLLGTLAVIGVSVGIGFLLIGIIQRFLHLRG